MPSTAPRGYVIHAIGSTYLWEYQAPGHSPNYPFGRPVHFDGIRFGHPPVSNELKAKFVVWAQSLIPTAERKRKDWPEYVSAIRRVDTKGKWLAVLLRSEISPGPVIIYEEIFRDPCGGPRAWQVTDEAGLEPYVHRPAAGYVIDHDEMGEWAWEYRPAKLGMLGSEVGVDDRWYGHHAIPRRLVNEFRRWHGQWARSINGSVDQSIRVFDWNRHNQEGIALSRKLKRAVGVQCTVIYLRPYEEPRSHRPWNALEVRSDGAVRYFEHRPYWARRELIAADESQG